MVTKLVSVEMQDTLEIAQHSKWEHRPVQRFTLINHLQHLDANVINIDDACISIIMHHEIIRYFLTFPICRTDCPVTCPINFLSDTITSDYNLLRLYSKTKIDESLIPIF